MNYGFKNTRNNESTTELCTDYGLTEKAVMELLSTNSTFGSKNEAMARTNPNILGENCSAERSSQKVSNLVDDYSGKGYR